MIQHQKFRANGKLLISAEYFVLYGADALAIPTSKGQTLEVLSNSDAGSQFSWTTNVLGEQVYQSKFDHLGKCLESHNDDFTSTLEEIFAYILLKKGTDFFTGKLPLQFSTEIEFPLDWGLGSSSTLIANLASWADLDPFDFQRSIFKGSGYDVACAITQSPIVYRLDNQRPTWREVPFNPPFSHHLFFIHLNKKQNSREAISRIKKYESAITDQLLSTISDITGAMCNCTEEKQFSSLMTEHEEIVSSTFNIATVKKEFFNDYCGAVKSLGAWGGDFIMVTGTASEMDYFRKKGYETIIPFEQMILAPR